MIKGSAIVLTNGWLDDVHAKTAHGLLRGSERFDVKAVIDKKFAGEDLTAIVKNAGPAPIYGSVAEALEKLPEKPQFCLVGVAVHGGILPASMREDFALAIREGLSGVSGLHSFIGDDPEFKALAEASGAKLIDIRRPRPTKDLPFWSGAIYSIDTPRIAVLGTDCAIGKRTTCRMVMRLCQKNGIKAEMIYTGQTGWMEGHRYGFIFDSTLNDFISGEIERCILECDKNVNPDLMLVEGQSSLRNPGGPCGSEFIISGDVRGVILQHAAGREYFDGVEGMPGGKIPSVESEIALIKFYGAETLAITLNNEGLDDEAILRYQQDLEQRLGIPVVRPFAEGLERLLPPIQKYMADAYRV